MIPRRRIQLSFRDALDMLAAVWHGKTRNHADVARFEEAFAQYLDCRYARATASGRDALELILDGLGLTAGDELVIPAYTLGELLPLMQARGLQLIAADVDPQTLNLTTQSVTACLTERTRGILVAHLFGAPCDIVGICALAGEHGIPVIEDCAHALGASVEGRRVGSFGRAALFSLEVNKAVPTFGGGLLVTNDPALALRIGAVLDARPCTEWPALRKAVLKYAEELLVRSPLYGLLSRLLFAGGGGGGGRFEHFYRRFHDRVRARQVAYSGFQARIGLRRLRHVDSRNARLNARWQTLASQLAAPFEAVSRASFGKPAFYNFVAFYRGEIGTLRRQAQAAGLDLGVGSEVMDNTAALLGQAGCPGAAAAFNRAVQCPLYDGLTDSRFERMGRILRCLAADRR